MAVRVISPDKKDQEGKREDYKGPKEGRRRTKKDQKKEEGGRKTKKDDKKEE